MANGCKHCSHFQSKAEGFSLSSPAERGISSPEKLVLWRHGCCFSASALEAPSGGLCVWDLQAAPHHSPCSLPQTRGTAPGALRPRFPGTWPVGAPAEPGGRESMKMGHRLPFPCLGASVAEVTAPIRGPFHLPGQDSRDDYLDRLILLSSQGGRTPSPEAQVAPPHAVHTL